MKKIKLYETFLNERDVSGKYNTVSKVISAIGRRPSEQEVAEFIVKNFKGVTGANRGDIDPAESDKIADIVAFYKFDIDDWLVAWKNAQNESVVTESEIIHHQYDFEGMWAQKLGMTREEYVAHFATMTVGVDEAKLKDIKGKQFEVKGANFTYVEQTGRFYGVYLYDVAKTSNVAHRLKLSSMTDANEFLALHGITEQLPYRYDEKELDVICKKLTKQGIVCNHADDFDVS